MGAPDSRPRRRSSPPRAGGFSWERALPWAVAALCALRLVGLGRWGLWIDEAFTLHDARALSLERLTDFPLNLYLISVLLELTPGPPGEATLRALPCLFGMLGIAATYWAFEPLIGRRRALVAALLVGLSSYHMFWSQSARHYTLAQTLSVWGSGLVLRGCKRAAPHTFLAGLALALFAAFAHPSAALLVPALLLAPWLSARLGAPLPWSPPTRWIVAVTGLGAVLIATWGAQVWGEYSGKKSGSSLLHLLQTCGFYFGPPLALAAAWSALEGLARRRSADALAALVLAMVLACALCAALFAKVAAQYVFVLLPWAAAAASGVVLSERPRGWAAYGLSTLALVWGAADLGLYLTTRHGDRPRWKEAYALVARSRGPEDLVYGMAAPVGEYYLAPGNPAPRNPLHLARLTHYEDRLVDVWVRRERRIWIVLNREDLFDWPRDDRERFLRFLREQCERVRTFPVGATPRDLDVEVYLRP